MKIVSAVLTANWRWLGIAMASLVIAGCAKPPDPPAEDPAATQNVPPTSPVLVNGALVTSNMFELAIAARLAQGQQDSLTLRQSVREDVINREILAQQATVLKLDQLEKTQLRLQLSRQLVMADQAMDELMSRSPVTDAEMRAEYNRQIASLGDPKTLFEYRVGLITVDTEADAKTILARLKKKVPFEQLARERSKDASKDSGGLLDWLQPNQMLPAVSQVVTQLEKGAVAPAPIQTPGGWNVIRLVDVRQYEPPALAEVGDRIRRSLIQQKRAEIIRRLRASAKITTPQTADQALPGAAGSVVINGFLLSGKLIEQAVLARLAQGQQDTPAMRQGVREDIINRELLAQEAVVLGIDRAERIQLRVQQAKQAILADQAMEELMAQSPVTDTDVQAEYDRQIAALGDFSTRFEYQVRLITVSTEAEAKRILNSLRKRVPFERLAREKSADASKDKGGLLDWLEPNQMVPAVAEAVVKLKKGTHALAPIKTPTGWSLVRLEDSRQVQPPTLADLNDRIRRTLTQQKRAEIIRKLRAGARLTTPPPAVSAAKAR